MVFWYNHVKLAEGLYMVSVNVILDACFVISDIRNVDINIVHLMNPRLRWSDNIIISLLYFVM